MGLRDEHEQQHDSPHRRTCVVITSGRWCRLPFRSVPAYRSFNPICASSACAVSLMTSPE